MEKVALISITDYGDSPVELKNKPEFLLWLSFNDVPLGKALEAEYGRKNLQMKRQLKQKKNFTL